MVRIPRLIRNDRPTVYHVISRTTLSDFLLGSWEKDSLLTGSGAGLARDMDRRLYLVSRNFEKFSRKWTDLSEFVREVKQSFSRLYNKRHKRLFLGGPLHPGKPCRWQEHLRCC